MVSAIVLQKLACIRDDELCSYFPAVVAVYHSHRVVQQQRFIGNRTPWEDKSRVPFGYLKGNTRVA